MEIGSSALNVGREGWNQASEALTDASQRIAAAPVNGQDEDAGASALQATGPEKPGQLTDELIQLRVAEHQTRASGKVMMTADEVVGTLLDIKA